MCSEFIPLSCFPSTHLSCLSCSTHTCKWVQVLVHKVLQANQQPTELINYVKLCSKNTAVPLKKGCDLCSCILQKYGDNDIFVEKNRHVGRAIELPCLPDTLKDVYFWTTCASEMQRNCRGFGAGSLIMLSGGETKVTRLKSVAGRAEKWSGHFGR